MCSHAQELGGRREAGLRLCAVFDMGNVILPFDHLKPCQILAQSLGLEAEVIHQRIFGGGLETKFETGLIDGQTFLGECEKALGTRLGETKFRQIWSDIFTEDKAVADLIRQLRDSCRLVLLSNTNQWHFEHVRLTFPVIAEFDHFVLSYEVGAMKPSRKIFERALRFAEGTEKSVYIDDIAKYVEAAGELGLEGHVFECAADLRKYLIGSGLLQR